MDWQRIDAVTLESGDKRVGGRIEFSSPLLLNVINDHGLLSLDAVQSLCNACDKLVKSSFLIALCLNESNQPPLES